MSELERKLKNASMTRREMLSFLGKTTGTIAGIGLGMRCSNPTTPEPPPVSVTVKAVFYNHTQGLLGEKTYNGMSRDPLTIKVSDLPSTEGVDQNRIAVRESANGGYLGEQKGFSKNKEVNIVFPNQSMTYDVYLMNHGPTGSRHYQKIDNWNTPLITSPNAKWHREDRDGYTGPKAPINNVTWQLHNALQYSWAKYGSLNKVGSGGEFGIGYGYCNNWMAMHSKDWAGVYPDRVTHNIFRLRVFNSEIFELITQTADIANDYNSYALITDPYTGNLNEIGRDLFAYAHVIDNQTVGSSSKAKLNVSIGFF